MYLNYKWENNFLVIKERGKSKLYAGYLWIAA